YWSTDNAGNEETHHTGYVNIDTTLPSTTAAGLQMSDSTGWIKTSQSVTLTPTDAGGSGLAATYYTIDGVQYTYSGPFTVSAAGSHTITYWSTDNAGNEETHHSGYVNIDTLKPTSQATKTVTVKRGKKAKLAFKINDRTPSCGTAAVTITIKLKAKIVKTIKITSVPTNEARSYSFKVTLKKGSYTWTVKAKDAAGNVGNASVAKKLIVK
ncbi:MAG TPA: Ig-like domain-containing protein, partial [Candidatus Limnocylindrales bacterium]